MSDSPIKATLKSGTGYDAPWLTVDADNPADLEQRLRGIIDSKVMETVAEAASLFQATTSAAPLTQPQAPAQQQEQAPSWAAQAPSQQAAPQQPQGWGAAAQQVPQQAAPPQQGGRGQFAGPPHPEGKTCQCGQVLEFKTTGSGKGVYRCSQWRWQNGNPTPNHDQEWAN